MNRTCIAAVAVALTVVSGTRLIAQGQQSAPSTVPRFNGFGVSLVLGETQPSGPTEKLPAGATKALSDLKDFLPYKSYRVLDTLWLSDSNLHSSVKGLDGKSYELYIDTTGGHGPTDVAVRMIRLWESGADRIFGAFPGVSQEPPNGRLGRGGLAVAAPLIDAKPMSINYGETVVVGTSRLQGDRALILLITALTR